MSVTIESLKAEFPDFAIKSEPDPKCSCAGTGVRGAKSGNRVPCLCTCLTIENEIDRAGICDDFGNAFRQFQKAAE